MSKINEDTVGQYFTIDGDDVWQHITYSSQPTATMLNLNTEERINGTIRYLESKPFIRLIPDGDVMTEKDDAEKSIRV